MNKIRLIAMNGPLGIGKSWVGDRLEERCRHSGVRILRMSWQDVLADGVQKLLGAEHLPYATFKVTDFYGLTGRQWMIRTSEEHMKKVDPLIFSKILHDRMRIAAAGSVRPLLVYADSNGFAEELLYFRGREDVDTLACCIEPLEFHDRRDLPWIDGDSRFNLANQANVVAKDSTLMLDRVIGALQRRGWL